MTAVDKPPRLELRQLRYVAMVAECGSITRAAARLGIAQPSLSEALSRLEQDLDTALLVRGKHGVILTEADSSLLNEYICEVTRTAGRDSMTVRIETLGDTGRSTETHKRLLKQRLGVEIDVQLAKPGELAELTQIEKRQKPIRLIVRDEATS